MTLLEERPEETFRERSIPVLETGRLVLRAPRLEDVKAVAALANDRRIAQNTLRIPHPYTVPDASSFIAAANLSDGEATFAVTLGGDRIIGFCGVDVRNDGPELGYWLGVEYWGQGYTTEAARAVIDHVFETSGHDRLVSGARVSNPASRRVLEKCGFQWTGVGLYRIRSIGSSAPIDRFRLDRGLWTSLKNWAGARRVA
jgi:RimJ/RimL family protein N-acetyltransferase